MNPGVLGIEFFALGALLGAEQTAGPQWMLSQPLVAGAIAGSLTGQPMLGLLVGLWGQLTWNGAAPVGAKPHPDAPTGTLAGVLAGAALMPGESLLRAALIGIATCLVTAWVALWPIMVNRRLNARWTRWAQAAPDAAETMRRAGRAQGLAWCVTAAMSGAMVLAAAALAIRFAPVLLACVPTTGGAGGALVALLWGLGLGAGFPAFSKNVRSDWPWLAGGAAAAVGLKLLRSY